jgi:hypothetical protein
MKPATQPLLRRASHNSANPRVAEIVPLGFAQHRHMPLIDPDLANEKRTLALLPVHINHSLTPRGEAAAVEPAGDDSVR